MISSPVIPIAPLLEQAPTGPLDGGLQRLRSALPPALRARVKSAREMARARQEADREPLLTALPAFDRLLAGGLPRGQLVEVIGGRSSGRFSSVLAALAAVTAVGEAAGLVDLGDHLDPAAAAAMGMDLQRLLWLRPRNLKQALAGAEMLIGGGFPLVVIELGSPPLAGGRGAEGAWVRLAHAAREQGTALLVGSPYRVSGTAAAAVLQAERTRFAWEGGGSSPRILDGLSARLVVEKRRGALPGQAEAFALHASTLPRRLAPERPAAPPRRQAPMTPMAPMAPIAAWEPRLAAVG